MKDSKINVMWMGSALEPSGYGEASRNYLVGLDKYQDINLRFIPLYFWQGPKPYFGRAWDVIKRQSERRIPGDENYILVHHSTPDNWQVGTRRCMWNIGVTTFETDGLPKRWQRSMRMMDEIWTFSDFNRQVFEECGIRRPITVIPHGVDCESYAPTVQPLPELKRVVGDRFVFGSVFDWSPRKDPKALIQAYYTAFAGHEDVVLLMNLFHQFGEKDGNQKAAAQIRSIADSIGIPEADRPPVMLIANESIPNEIMPRLYATFDAYVLPSRGEGWGLTFSEAMASGLPTIGVDWSGNTAFMTSENSMLIRDYKLRTIRPQDVPKQPHYVGQKWAVANPDAVAECMRLVYEKPELRSRIGIKARNDMVDRFSWDAACSKARHRLVEIAGEWI